MDEEPLRAGFAPTLRRLRMEAGLTRGQMAERCRGLKPGYLAKIEQGERFPSEKLLPQIAEAIGTDLRTMLAMAEREGAARLASDPDQTAGQPADSGRLAGGPRSARGSMLSRTAAPTPDAVEPLLPVWLTGLATTLEPAVTRGEHHLLAELERLARLLTSVDLPADQLTTIMAITRRIVLEQPDRSARMEQLFDLALAYLRTLDSDDDRKVTRLLDVAHALVRSSERPVPHVATIPVGVDHHIWSTAVGRDTDGSLWVDPLASAHRAGLDDTDPRIRRLDDGRIHLDLSRLQQRSFADRDPARHRIRALLTRGLARHDPPLASYEATLIQMNWTDEVTIEVAPAALGVTDGSFPASHHCIHIITAHNPAPRVLPPEDNAQRNAQLQADIQQTGIAWRKATGASADPNEPWSEDSFALLDSDRAVALDLARRYEQAAIFEWTPQQRAVVLCNRADQPHDEAIKPTGWIATWG